MKPFQLPLRSRRAAIALVGSLMLTCHAQAEDTALHGAGATFPAKVYAQWASRYTQERRTEVAYEAVGSSKGVARIKAHEVDFGATDVPLSTQELEKHHLFQFPTLVGGIVPVVHLPGVPSGRLRLSSEVLASIFSGQITHWNAAAIAALNPGLKLPDLRITRVVRADGSGTSVVFVQYLKKTAPTQAAALTESDDVVRWPAGASLQAVSGSSAVVAAVKASPGAIGYVSSDYLVRDKLTAVSLRNKRGEWIEPGLEGYRAAVRAAGLFRNSLEAAPLLDVDGAMVWPIVTATYVVVPRNPASIERAGQTLNFFYRSFLLGDRAVAGSGFAPLPVETQARIVALLSSFRTPDGRPVPVIGQGADKTQIAAQ